MLLEEWTVAQTFELYGPTNYSTEEISKIVDREIMTTRRRINVPKALLKPAAYWLNKLIWWPTISADEVEREALDQVIDPTAKTLKDFGIEPAELSNLTFHYLVNPPYFTHSAAMEQKLTSFYSVDTEATDIRIFQLLQNERERKRKSTSTFWTTNRLLPFSDTVYTSLDSIDFIACSFTSKIEAQPCIIRLH